MDTIEDSRLALETPAIAHMTKGIIYLLTGPAHAARMVVSLWSLRQHYDGPVTIYTTHPESHEIGARCAGDNRLNVDHRWFSLVSAQKNASFLTKLSLLPHSPYDVTAYLDADTLVAGDVLELLNAAEESEFCATQFAQWQTSGRTIRRRIETWREIQQNRYPQSWLHSLIDEALVPQPAVNGGVFAYRRDAEILRPWFELSLVGQETFICDEIALQLLLNKYAHKVLDCRFNCSPIYGGPQEDVRIWHFHGEKHLRKESCRTIWLPAYQQCVEANVAGLAQWSPGPDKRLRRYLNSRPNGRDRSTTTDKNITLVTAVNQPYLEKLRLTLPTWQLKPQLSDCPLLVFYHGLAPEELSFIHEYRDSVRLVPWDMRHYESARELMLSAFVLGAPRLVETPYWVKLDADSFFLDDQDVFLDHMFDYDLAGHKWNYTKPGRWLAELDDWAQENELPGHNYLAPQNRALATSSRRYGHHRIASWICLHKTDFTIRAASYLKERLPVPSHDTYFWYLAERIPEFKWCWHNFKRRGAGTATQLEKIQQRIGEAVHAS